MRQGDKGTRGQGEGKKAAEEEVTLSPPLLVTPSLLLSFLAALQFLTIVPPVVRRPFAPAELGRAVGFFPLVGVLLGGVLAGVDRGLARVFPPEVAATLVLAAWIVLTGVLHFDGFLDTCDGLFGGHDPETRLRILRDERVGAYAVAGGVLLLLVKYAALAAISNRTATLILAPALGRWGMALAIVAFPYARPEGLGRAMKDHAGWGEVLLAGVIGLAVAVGMAGWTGLAGWVLAMGATLLVARFTLQRIPGLTGDIYGAVCELVEAATLLLFTALG